MMPATPPACSATPLTRATPHSQILTPPLPHAAAAAAAPLCCAVLCCAVLPLRREDAVARRTYKTRQETEAKKPVTATIVLTLLFISGGCAGCLAGAWE